MTEFANFLASAANSGGSGSGYMGPQNPSLMLPPVNISQTGGGAPDYNVINPYLSTNTAPYIPPAPPYVAPPTYVPPAASSSSSSSSAPIHPYERYRNYKFSNNYDMNNYGAEYNPSARTGIKYDADVRSADQYGQDYDLSERNLGGFKDRLKKSKKTGMRRLV
jgi:hypothetical protein